MTIHIAGDDKGTGAQFACDGLKDLKPDMWLCRPVERQTMPLESPGLARIAFKSGGVGDGREPNVTCG